MKEKLELDGNCKRKTSHIEKLVEQVKLLERQIHEMQEQHIKDTQVLVYSVYCLMICGIPFSFFFFGHHTEIRVYWMVE